MKEKEKNMIQEMAEQAELTMKQCEQAFQAGLKVQEEATQWWSTFWNQTAMAKVWQKRFMDFASVANRVIPAAQKRSEEIMDLAGKNMQASAQLLSKAIDAAQTPVMADSHAKWMEFWNSSMMATQANVETLTQINIRAIESWIGLVQKNIKVTEAQASKSAS